MLIAQRIEQATQCSLGVHAGVLLARVDLHNGLTVASMSNTQGLSSASRTECMSAGRIHAVLAASSMRYRARRSAVMWA